jgi:hypothetical protein
MLKSRPFDDGKSETTKYRLINVSKRSILLFPLHTSSIRGPFCRTGASQVPRPRIIPASYCARGDIKELPSPISVREVLSLPFRYAKVH